MSTFQDHVASFLDYLLKEKGYSSHTVEAYKTDLAQFGSFVAQNLANAAFEDIMKKSVLRDFTYTLGEQGLKSRSMARKVAALKSFSKFCVKRHILTASPAKLLANPKLDKPLPAFLTETQARQLASPAGKGDPDHPINFREAAPLSRSCTAPGCALPNCMG